MSGLIHEKLEHDVFNLGRGEGTSFIDMAQSIVEIVGSGSIKKISWPQNYERLETGNYISDQTKMKKIYQWNPSITIQEGIQKTFDFYRKHHSHYW